MTNNPIVSSNQSLQAQQGLPEKSIFFAEDKTVPYYDHPNFIARVVLPDDYTPLTRIEQLIELENKRVLNEDSVRVLKVVGDALCANEAQVKRYLKCLTELFGTSHTSRILNKLRKYGLVERYSTRITFLEEEDGDHQKKPAPYTLGFAGVKYLQHYYPDMLFVQSDTWRKSSAAVQRYIALNEIRCGAAEARTLRKWLWHPFIGGHSSVPVPLAVALVKNPANNSELQLIFERAQSSHDFLQHIKRRLDTYARLIHNDSVIRIADLSDQQPKVIVISCGTLSMARQMAVQLDLAKYKFPIWFVVDEWITSEYGLSGAFAQVKMNDGKVQVERFQLPIFNLPKNI